MQWFGLCAGAVLLFSALPARAGETDCGALDNAYGPYDYINAEHHKKFLPVVEAYHFDLKVETLTGGKSGSIMSDLDYTLRAFPNHHRALNAMARYQLKNGKPEADSNFRTIECYFDRAKRMNPRDSEVYAINGWYLRQLGDLEGALAQYRESEKLKPASINRDYQIGMLLFDMKRYEEARKYAERVYQRNFPDNALRDKLKSVNQWKG